MASKFMPTIGCDKYTFFPMLSDDASTKTATYGAAVSLPGLVQISPTDEGGSQTFDADNGAYIVTPYIQGIGHTLTVADVPPEVDAKWRGLTLKNGGVEVNNNVKMTYFGCAYRIMKADGNYRYFRAYKGVYSFASNVGGTTKASDGAPEMQTCEVTYKQAMRESDGCYYWYVDSETSESGAVTINGVAQETFEESFFSDLSYNPTN